MGGDGAGEEHHDHMDQSGLCVVDVVCGGWWMDMGCGVCVCVCVWWMGQDGMDNQIGDGGAEHIARALEKNTTITMLTLHCV